MEQICVDGFYQISFVFVSRSTIVQGIVNRKNITVIPLGLWSTFQECLRSFRDPFQLHSPTQYAASILIHNYQNIDFVFLANKGIHSIAFIATIALAPRRIEACFILFPIRLGLCAFHASYFILFLFLGTLRYLIRPLFATTKIIIKVSCSIMYKTKRSISCL